MEKILRERIRREFRDFLTQVDKTTLYVTRVEYELIRLWPQHSEVPTDIVAGVALVNVMKEEGTPSEVAISFALKQLQRVYALPIWLGPFRMPDWLVRVPKRSTEEYKQFLEKYLTEDIAA